MYAALLVNVKDATALVAADELLTTATLTVAVRPPAVAVTVMVRGLLSPAVVKVASADPVVSVVPCVTATPPELDEKVTRTPEMRSFAALRAKTVMVALAEPSAGMDDALDTAVSEAGLTAGAPTVTVVCPDTPPVAAVTVMVVPTAAVPAVKVTVA
jgi:hypothetical protein